MKSRWGFYPWRLFCFESKGLFIFEKHCEASASLLLCSQDLTPD
jgi:hypothetical protein